MKTRLLILVVAVAAGARAAETFALSPAAVAYVDGKGDPLKGPEGVACTAAGRVVAADSGNGRLLTWDFKDGALTGGTSLRFPELGYPARVQIDSKGNVLSLDRKTRRIVRVNDQGKFGGFVAPKGLPLANGYFPTAFKLDASDNVYVLDVASSRVVVLDKTGAFQRQISEPGDANFSDIAVDAKGTLLAVDGTHGVVYASAPGASAFLPLSKSLKDSMSFASYIATGPGVIVLVDNHGNGLVVLAADGTYLGRRLSIGWSAGLIYYPGQICIDERGDTFVADRGNNRVQAFTMSK
jgi:hypothetical protein